MTDLWHVSGHVRSHKQHLSKRRFDKSNKKKLAKCSSLEYCKMKVVVPLVTVVVLTVVLATQQQQVEFRTPHKIYSNVGNPIRFDFNVLSLNKNVSLNESLVRIEKFNSTEFLSDFKVKSFVDEDTGLVSRMKGKVNVEAATCG
ncbi:hypothetical protein ACHWQZ_G009008 [Mnemiopsis leidyi]